MSGAFRALLVFAALAASACEAMIGADFDGYEPFDLGASGAAGLQDSGAAGGGAAGSAGNGSSGADAGCETDSMAADAGCDAIPPRLDGASSRQTGANAVTIVSLDHTVSVENALLLVAISLRVESSEVVKSVEFGTEKLALTSAVAAGDGVRVEWWMLAPVSSGTSPVRVEISRAARFVVGALSLSRVDLTSPIAGFGSESGASGTAEAALTELRAGELAITALASTPGTTQADPAADLSEQWNIATSAGSDSFNVRGAGALGSGARSSWQLSSTSSWAIAALAVRGAGP
jgi:hypothetical protein